MNELEAPGLVDVETVLDLIAREKEVVLAIRAYQVDDIKTKLSQAKHSRGIKERLSMRPSEPYEFLNEIVIDLHCRLGSGTDIYLVGYTLVDNEL